MLADAEATSNSSTGISSADPAPQIPNDRSSGISYRRLRVPRAHGATLEVPPLNVADKLWSENLARQDRQSDTVLDRFDEIGIRTLGDWRTAAREEILTAAQAWTDRYAADLIDRDRNVDLSGGLVMSGHQPELYHPGVWFKNFALSRLASNWGAVPINLVVDADLCGRQSVSAPHSIPNGPEPGFQLSSIAIDRPGPQVPYEMRPITDREFFAQFPDRVGQMRDLPTEAIAMPLWDEVREAEKRLAGSAPPEGPALGACLAAGRHRLELRSGLHSFELPLSQIAGTHAFAQFSVWLLQRLATFSETYNQILADYRQIHGIRSQSHPVPSLDRVGNRWEMPFWVWQPASPERKPLWVEPQSDGWRLSDGQGWEALLRRENPIQQWRELNASVCLRPRALMTTLFSRLLISDLFFHGIGGAKYDQLTDALAQQVLGATLPDYQTLSATLLLPLNYPVVQPADVTRIDVRQREYRFHPERYVDPQDPRARSLIAEKLDWISGDQRDVRSREKHVAIERINAELRSLIPVTDEQLADERERLRGRLRSSEIVTSRDYSFALHDISIIDDLRQLAAGGTLP